MKEPLRVQLGRRMAGTAWGARDTCRMCGVPIGCRHKKWCPAYIVAYGVKEVLR